MFLFHFIFSRNQQRLLFCWSPNMPFGKVAYPFHCYAWWYIDFGGENFFYCVYIYVVECIEIFGFNRFKEHGLSGCRKGSEFRMLSYLSGEITNASYPNWPPPSIVEILWALRLTCQWRRRIESNIGSPVILINSLYSKYEYIFFWNKKLSYWLCSVHVF